MILTPKAALRTRAREVHLSRPGGPACGAPRRSLVAMNSHGDDCLAWVTCPACKLLAVRGCYVQAVTAV